MATKKGSSGADKFNEAKARVEKLPKRPSNDQLLDLYAFYKQATEGDVSGSRPGREMSTASAQASSTSRAARNTTRGRDERACRRTTR